MVLNMHHFGAIWDKFALIWCKICIIQKQIDAGTAPSNLKVLFRKNLGCNIGTKAYNKLAPNLMAN